MRSTTARHGVLLLLLAWCLLTITACGDTIAPPSRTAGQPPQPVPCKAYQADPGKAGVYQVPTLTAGDPRRCSIAGMALAVHNKGEFRDVYGADPNVSPPPWQAISPVIETLRREAGGLQCPKDHQDCQPIFRILIFAHGGLVSQNDAVLRDEALAPGMMTDGYAPIFLIWNSDFPTAYGNRLCCVLEGEANESYAPYFVPVRLVGDLVSSVARTLENFGQQLIRFDQSVIKTSGTEYYLKASDVAPGAPDSLCASIGNIACPSIVYPEFTSQSSNPTDAYDHLNGLDQRTVEKTAGYAVTAPFRVVTTMLGPEAGAQAWDNMVRRTRLALQAPIVELGRDQVLASDCTARSRTAYETTRRLELAATNRSGGKRFAPTGEGAFVLFFNRLQCEIEQHRLLAANRRPVKVELHFYGHSMGALVGNELLARYPDLPWRRIVYMAAATPVRDFKYMVVPMLTCAAGDNSQICADDPHNPRHPGVHFYNLMLHPLAESHDLEKYGVVPEGSLLEWIDEMFGGPKSVDDRMLGKWTNVEKTMSWFPPLARQRMAFRVFPAQAKMRDGDHSEYTAFTAECVPVPGQAALPERCHPIMHGEFASYSFWRDTFLCGTHRCRDAEPPYPPIHEADQPPP